MGKLKPSDPMRVFVGASPGGQDVEAYNALAHSLRSRTARSVAIEVLSTDTQPGWQSQHWGTPWTALRWAVPELCGWRGRAIYFDCPTLVLADIAALVDAPMPDHAFVLLRRHGRVLSTACAVFDCARAKRFLRPIVEMREDAGAHQSVGVLLERHPPLVGPLPNGWGAPDSEFSRNPRGTYGSVHFASPYTQPHVPRARARLARAGRRHWFDGVLLPHYCEPLVQRFELELAGTHAEAQA